MGLAGGFRVGIGGWSGNRVKNGEEGGLERKGERELGSNAVEAIASSFVFQLFLVGFHTIGNTRFGFQWVEAGWISGSLYSVLFVLR